MENFKHILVISRMIPYSREAIKIGIFLARKYDAKLMVLHLVTNTPLTKKDYDKLFDWLLKHYPKQEGNIKLVRKLMEETVNTKGDEVKFKAAVYCHKAEQEGECQFEEEVPLWHDMDTFVMEWTDWVPRTEFIADFAEGHTHFSMFGGY
jgi:hypothetical protein